MAQKHFALCVKVVVRDSAGKCLVVKRSAKSRGNPGRWEFPGGKIDPGESFDVSLMREVQEETALRISLLRALGIAQSELPERHMVHLIMEASLDSGEVVLSEEHEGYAWVEPHELANLDMAQQFVPFVRAYAGEASRPAVL
jgi:8-oxo-dGTP diphosphatase